LFPPNKLFGNVELALNAKTILYTPDVVTGDCFSQWLLFLTLLLIMLKADWFISFLFIGKLLASHGSS
jgi:hypothetical protein